jgi:hypothetical protein
MTYIDTTSDTVFRSRFWEFDFVSSTDTRTHIIMWTYIWTYSWHITIIIIIRTTSKYALPRADKNDWSARTTRVYLYRNRHVPCNIIYRFSWLTRQAGVIFFATASIPPPPPWIHCKHYRTPVRRKHCTGWFFEWLTFRPRLTRVPDVFPTERIELKTFWNHWSSSLDPYVTRQRLRTFSHGALRNGNVVSSEMCVWG